jgi:peptidoglycan/LPS O-acetylase OafA/YrhL
MNYRSEIDGLRGIAVLSVVFYHLEILINQSVMLPGGFLGVDIFFVISGYLITSLLHKEYLKNNSISIKNFYLRRSRRILPALIVLIVFIIIFSYFFIFPKGMVDLSRSIISTLLFLSNFYFLFNRNNYFAESSEQIPLLHTWSLSVEEQFYIFFPFILLIVLKYYKKNLSLFLLIGIFLSFTLSVILSKSAKPEIISLNFYLFPTRAWELLLGAFVAINEFQNKYKIKNYINTIIVGSGLILLFFSFFLADEETKLSSYKTIFAVLGALSILFIKKDNFFYKYFLSTRPMVYIGLISYSLYLWHFPVLIFFENYYFTDIIFNNKVTVLLLSFIFAIISFHFIEKPFRNYRFINDKSFVTILLVFIFTLFCISFSVIKYDGFKHRFSSLFKNYPDYIFDTRYHQKKWDQPLRGYYSKEVSNINLKKNKRNIVFIGNSHAVGFFRMFNYNSKEYKNTNFYLMRIDYKNFIKESLKNDIVKNSDILILASRWSKNSFDEIVKFNEYAKKNDKKLLVILNRPEFSQNTHNLTLLDLKILEKIKDNKIINMTDFYKFSKIYFNNMSVDKIVLNNDLKILLDKNGIRYFDPAIYACSFHEKTCDVITVNKEKIYFDYGHYTKEGSEYFGIKILKNNFFINFFEKD